MFYQSASQQETDGTLKLGQFEESLLKEIVTKVWAECKKIAREGRKPQD